ncbi:hypothetical protein EN949_25425 [Mesorhizobium sp. M7A.F.Ca.US.007.01.2.1]|nr:hypothetical protein EN949_25425 [Mesorhizobium sp. M7A.F.Ca.US.007.01.2.1]
MAVSCPTGFEQKGARRWRSRRGRVARWLSRSRGSVGSTFLENPGAAVLPGWVSRPEAPAPKQPISPLVGEMSGRTEGGRRRAPTSVVVELPIPLPPSLSGRL